ncbi:MAG: isoleucine--tRNA ligase [Maricaulaceae bacterium]
MSDLASPAARDYRETLFLPQTDFPMRGGLPKAEPQWLERWDRIDLYARLNAERANADTFVLHDGPPYANGHIHIGTGLNKILKDFVCRSKWMAGYRAPYAPGWDCHGLPIEWKVEEAFRAKGRKKDDIDPLDFRKACREYAQNWLDVQREEFKRLGVMGDWEQPYTTMDFASEAEIVRQFLAFKDQGLVFRGSKPVMWSPVERTALAEAEIEYQDHVSTTIWVRFPVAEGPETLKGADVVIWTTTPWTIPANRAVCYGPHIAYGVYEVTAMAEDLDFAPWAKPGDRLIVADALWPSVADAGFVTGFTRIGDASADALGAAILAHPLAAHPDAGAGYAYPVPLLAGDHVTDDAGTGFVHTAPGHGADDYAVWRAHGHSEVPETVGPDGRYFDHVPLFAGEAILKTEGKKAGQDGSANKAVVSALIAANTLLARGRLSHSYPHSWRSKAPLIFRNTPQWFIRLGAADDPTSLRAKALSAVDATQWNPAQSINRIRSMVADRPDWLISRQRAWGAPITLFVNARGDILNDKAVDARILAAIETRGADAWFDTPASDFLGPDYDPSEWEKVTDILDVWFDSGSTHAFTLEPRGLPWPADVYFEGSDQHRGWFQSSLLVGCGTRGRAPYEAVLTHGFVLDGEGRKMSKSLGNVVAPNEVAIQYGVEILRLWAASQDYADDLRISDEILKTAVDAYRKIRNTWRYLLGALHGFSEAEALAPTAMPGLERFMLHRLAELDTTVREAYGRFDFKRVFSTLFNTLTGDLSAFYLDIRKDSLYCDRPDAERRRAARAVMGAYFDRLTVWLAPILSFTAEEAWLSRYPSEDGSVHLQVWPETPQAWFDPALADQWAVIRKLRRVVTGALEVARREKRIGSSLEANPTVYVADPAYLKALEGEDLADICITSQARLSQEPAPEAAFRSEDVADVGVVVDKAEGRKCARSWRITPDVGADPRYPELSARDADAVAAWDAAREAQA